MSFIIICACAWGTHCPQCARSRLGRRAGCTCAEPLLTRKRFMCGSPRANYAAQVVFAVEDPRDRVAARCAGTGRVGAVNVV